MTARRRRFTALTALIVGGLLLIGAAGQIAKMIIPEGSPQAHKRISDVAPILIGGFLIGASAQTADDAPAGTASGHAVLAMNKAELVG
ncbi:hypothetical protein [Streptomyces sp. NPDC014894]|uniref:hypothetical protein n=1 Tax=unclassified Streptomyces TaxID=2593676 RepID=UPI003700E9AE